VALLDKIVYAGSNSTSFAHGSQVLLKLAEVEVSAKQVERVCKGIGTERVAQRDAAVAAYQALPLTERKQAPPGVTAPALAVVGCDGGRLQILQRHGPAVEAEEAAPAADGRRGKHWREDKIGLLMTMHSSVSVCDPCPEIPEPFVDPTRIVKLARELKKQALPDAEAVLQPPEADGGVVPPAAPAAEYEPPKVLEKRCVGSRVRWPTFGPLLATAAWTWGFFAAERKAFLGDGSDNNWTIWRQHFSSFTPVLDFIHALSYVFAAALAGRTFAAGWSIYVQWIGWVWSGQVGRVIAALEERQQELGTPLEQDGDTSPRRVVAEALTYLHNHQSQMHYADYRRLGLPITSSYVESAVKQFNRRVKGTEKFWSEPGAEALLQLRADHLSDDTPLQHFWETRQDNETGQRPYRKVA
jgi:hypothetical protein